MQNFISIHVYEILLYSTKFQPTSVIHGMYWLCMQQLFGYAAIFRDLHSHLIVQVTRISTEILAFYEDLNLIMLSSGLWSFISWFNVCIYFKCFINYLFYLQYIYVANLAFLLLILGWMVPVMYIKLCSIKSVPEYIIS